MDLQIVSIVLTCVTIIATLFAWSWTKGKIEGEVLTKLEIQESDIKELKVSLASLTTSNGEVTRTLEGLITGVRERVAVLEFRANEIDKQIADRRGAHTRSTD